MHLALNRSILMAALLLLAVPVLIIGASSAQSKLKKCPSDQSEDYDNCYGTAQMDNGGVYTGEWKNNQLHGYGTYKFSNGDKYVGEFKDGKKHGRGTFTWTNGDRYVGEYKSDQQNGQGEFVFGDGQSKGDRYVGEFKNDMFNGSGIYSYASGDKYVGEEKDSEKSGLGTETYINGDKYVGEFRSDQKNGQGTYFFADGTKYVGTFKDNLPNGRGANYAADGSAIEQGIFKDGTLITPDENVAQNNSPAQDTGVTEQSAPSNTDVKIFQHKVALIIGNGAYENAPRLPNPRNDAQAMSSMLSDMGFIVVTAIDANKSDMEQAIREFLRETKSADLSLFFYSGHGMEVGGENFLLPVDTRLEDESSLNFEVINSKVITNAMGGDNQVGVILLDACRSNPFTKSLKRSMAATRAAAVSDGLAAMSTEGGGLVVAFATSPGDTASDGSGRNSPFTTALLKWMPQKGLEVELMMKKVKSEVSSVTNNDQRPWTNSDLTTEVYLAGE